MYAIDAEFVAFNEITLLDLVGATGVYVLWTARALAKPSYLGEGDILQRVQAHRTQTEWGSTISDGLVAVMGSANPKQRKHDAEVVEAMLLEAAEHIGCFPHYNTQPGKFRRVMDRLAGSDKTVRVTIRGRHPLRWGNSVRAGAALHARKLPDGDYWLEHPWRSSAG